MQISTANDIYSKARIQIWFQIWLLTTPSTPTVPKNQAGVAWGNSERSDCKLDILVAINIYSKAQIRIWVQIGRLTIPSTLSVPKNPRGGSLG